MSIAALRELLRPQRSLWRAALIATAAVGAVLVGLLAMHSLNLESHHNDVVVSESASASATAEAHHHAVTLAAGDATAGSVINDDCAGDCGMDHTMLGACVLALVFGGLAFVGAAVLSRWTVPDLDLTSLSHTPTAAIPLAPPSLIVLSISRT